MLRKYLLLYVVVFSPLLCRGQNWVKKYYVQSENGFESGLKWAVEAYDKGFYIAGEDLDDPIAGSNRFRVYKTDVNGNILWQRIVGRNVKFLGLGAIVATSDGGVAITGNIYYSDTSSNADIFLIKLNVCGDMDWSKIYSLNQNCFSGSLAVLENGDFIVESQVAINKDSIPNYYNSWIFRTDPKGNLKWSNFDNLFSFDMTLDHNDNILTTGHVYRDGLSIYGGINKTDSLGRRVWQTVYGYDEHFNSSSFESVETNDGGYLSAATKAGSIFNILLIKYNANGMPEWRKTIGDTTLDECPVKMIAMNDSTYLISAISGTYAQHYFAYTENLKLLKIDGQGRVLKQFIYPNTGVDRYFWSVSPTSDGKFIIAGEITTNNGDSIIVLKINKNLELDSFYTHDTNKYDYLCNQKIPYSAVIDFSTDSVPITIPFPNTDTLPIPGSFLVYPNPTTSSIVHIRCPAGNSNATLTMYDVLGRLINTYTFVPEDTGHTNFDLGNVASGCYIMVLWQDGKRYVQKVIVQ